MFIETWAYEAAIGPFVSPWQFSWTLFLSKQGITAYRYSFRETLNLMGKLKYGSLVGGDPHQFLKQMVSEGKNPSLLFDRSRVKQITIEEIQEIEITHRSTLAHRLRLIPFSGSASSFTIAIRTEIDSIRSIVKDVYDNRVHEKGFE